LTDIIANIVEIAYYIAVYGVN